MTPLPAKEITVTLPQLPHLFPGSTAEEKLKVAVCWAIERMGFTETRYSR
jgi:hypothetical protein